MSNSINSAAMAGLGAIVLASGIAQASLVGDDIVASVLVGGSAVATNNETVLAGPEANGNWLGLLNYNIEADTITVSSAILDPAFTWNPGLGFQFTDLDFVGFPNREIIGATVIASDGNGFSAITDADLTWTSDSLTIDGNAVAGTAARLDQFVTVQLQTRDVPAPASLAVLGLGAMAAGRRRRA